MSRRITSGIKKRIIAKLRQNRPVPTWVVIRTNRRVRSNPKRRNWRRSKLTLR